MYCILLFSVMYIFLKLCKADNPITPENTLAGRNLSETLLEFLRNTAFYRKKVFL